MLCSARLFLQGYEVRKITAHDQDLGQPRGIGYTIISGLTHIISLTFTAQRSGSITSYHNFAAIIDKCHQVQQSITAARRAELESRRSFKLTLIRVQMSSRQLLFGFSFSGWCFCSNQD